ncbi:hypothetical protein NMY22_g2823 [Coprinellus aureogranulatus]|nr:hypothetical protein NMY22_g2823 [Coprinellus aureogranulatus]
MPAAAIAQSVSKIIAENASEFQKTIQDDLRKRFTFRSTPSLLQSAKTIGRATASAKGVPAPVPAPAPRALTPPPEAFSVKQEDVEMLDAEHAMPPSASAPSSPTKRTPPLLRPSPLPAPRPNSVVMRLKKAPVFGSAAQSTSASASATTLVRDGLSSLQGNPESVSSRSAPPDPASKRLEFAIVAEELSVGKGPEKFRWWNTQTTSFTSPEEIPLEGTPQPGDILTYWDTRRNQAGVYIYLAFGWAEITEDFFRNTGKIRHPAFGGKNSRILTWRSSDKKFPSYVKENTFKQSKQNYTRDSKHSMQDFVKDFSAAHERLVVRKHTNPETVNTSPTAFSPRGLDAPTCEVCESGIVSIEGLLPEHFSLTSVQFLLLPEQLRRGKAIHVSRADCHWQFDGNSGAPCPSLSTFEVLYRDLGSRGVPEDVIIKHIVCSYVATFCAYLKSGGMCAFQLETLRLRKDSPIVQSTLEDYMRCDHALNCSRGALAHLRRAYGELRAKESIRLLDYYFGQFDFTVPRSWPFLPPMCYDTHLALTQTKRNSLRSQPCISSFHSSALTARWSPTVSMSSAADFGHLLEKVDARSVARDYMRHYGIISKPCTPPASGKAYAPRVSSNTKYVVTRLLRDYVENPCSSSGAEMLSVNPAKIPSLQDLLDDGYQRISYCSDPHLIVDSKGRILAAVIPAPLELLEAGINAAFLETMAKTQAALDFMAASAVTSSNLPWDTSTAISVGVSGPWPFYSARNIPHTRQNAKALENLSKSSAIHTIASWQSRCCEMVMPKLYEHNKITLDRLCERNPSLSRPFPGTGFALATFDFGPHAGQEFYSRRRLPSAPGVCAITFGGTFNHKLGGHFILKEVRAVIETPACCTILLPCSMFTYGSVSIADMENRVSMVQCSSGSCTHNISGQQPPPLSGLNAVFSSARRASVMLSPHTALSKADIEAIWKKYQLLMSTVDEISTGHIPNLNLFAIVASPLASPYLHRFPLSGVQWATNSFISAESSRMPKAQAQPPRRNRKSSKPGLVVCRCKARCLKLNPATGKYEGKGVPMSPKARVRHRRDERLSALLAETIGTSSAIRPVDLDDEPDNQRAWETLIRAHLEAIHDIPITSFRHPLEFANNPKESGPYQYEYDEEASTLPECPNSGLSALDTGVPANRRYLNKENALWEICRTLDSFEQSSTIQNLRSEVFQELVLLEREKAFRWETLREGYTGGPHYNTEVFFRKRPPRTPPVDAASIVSLVLQFHHFLPRRGSEVYLAGTKDVVLSQAQPDLDPHLLRFPKDPRPLVQRFSLDPITSTYVVCPSCHCLYPFDPISAETPDVCTFRQTPTSEECSTSLWKELDRGPFGNIRVPVRKYVHQTLKPWLGRVLSRPGMEKTIHDYPRQLLADNTGITDIWQGSVFRQIKDSTGNSFFPGPKGDLRIAFGMSVDGFATFQNKTAKQSCSSTGIWLVLLNLPPHLRYLPQNVYLAGIIPGPNKPSNDQINHYLSLVVQDLKELWRPGIHFSRTYECLSGRLCKGLLIPLICDLLGAHQVIGYPGAPTAHYFCTCCELDIDDINIIDPNEWPRKSLRHIRRYAQIYRDATSEKDQQAVFEACGWRWSPLFELEYWDPAVFTVIDSMHSLDLNLLKHHVQDLFQIDLLHNGGGALRPPTLERSKRVVATKAELRSLERCQNLIYDNPPFLLYELLQFHRKILYSFSLDYDIRPPGQNTVTGTRWVLSKCIYEWRQQWVETSHTLRAFMERYPELSVMQQSLVDDHEDDSTEMSETEELEQPDGDNLNGSLHVEPEGTKGVGISTQPSSSALPNFKVLAKHARKLLSLVESDSTSDAVYKAVTVKILAHFCDILSIARPPAEQMNGGSQTAKQRLFHLVTSTLKTDEQRRQQLENEFSQREDSTSSSYPFLGKDVMEAVWRDMSRTHLPSWITPAPRDWGTSRRGKLSADNWRIICCIHLPITLIRLFGSSTGRPRQLLDNFMHLVSAVRIATMRTSSKEQVSAYNHHIFKYTHGTLELYPDYNILPSHHGALHIGDVLTRFGPKHSHDSPYYERFINFFHHMNTNNKSGEVEATFLRTAVRNANLLSLLSESPEDQQRVTEMLSRLHSHEKERLRGFRLAEALCPFNPTNGNPGDDLAADEQQELEDNISPMELNWLRQYLQSQEEQVGEVSSACRFLDAVSHGLNIYAPWNSPRYRDSRVLFRYNGEEKAGIIQKIFMHRYRPPTGQPEISIYLIVKAFDKIDGEDRFLRYGYAGGFLSKPGPTNLSLIPAKSILCHVALTDITEEEVIHVLPINRTVLSLETERPWA